MSSRSPASINWLPWVATLNYKEGIAKIPAAAVSVEDADMIQRLVRGGSQVQVRLMMEAHQDADADSHNVMGEIRGSEKPEEVVVLGGHIDSWDIGQGANDDGSGIMATFQAVALMKKLGLRPRRTVRVCFWVNEENGGAGGVAYRKMVGRRDRQSCGCDRNGWRGGKTGRIRLRWRRSRKKEWSTERRRGATASHRSGIPTRGRNWQAA